ncbi:MAG: bifunctional phosphopantothenoylcysteine decarboxylase/phosphopantothenate--cysteine ligase CoaBC, partial [Nitrosarchaeum sp.]|nr:bifunctional phosphopantothenoylcysteine decarboxylase/phosphopantothenate--cysteine ligase CoaBC [Nitrosarchaeum sp.]
NPQMIEGKAKAPEPEDVLNYVLKRFGFSSVLQNKNILITAGPTIEYVDPIRVITNQSSGRTGVLLARELVSSGAKVTLVYGPGIEEPPKGVKTIRVATSKEMLDAVKREMKRRFDIVIMAAAIADYIPENPSKRKIKSNQNRIKINLRKAPKIINQIKKIQKDTFLIGFKAEVNLSKKDLIKEAKKKMVDSNADMIIANDIGNARYKKNPNKNEVVIVDSKRIFSSGWISKQKVAKLIRKEIEKKIEGN